MEMDLAFFAIAVPAVLVAGISKGGLSGLGVLSVPLLALVISPAQAAALMLPILCLMDLFGLWAFRRCWSREHIRVMLPGAIAGIALGSLTFGHLSDDGVRILVGAIAVLFALNNWLRAKGRLRPDAAARPSALQGGFWSALSGFTSMLAHAGGPPVMIYLLPLRLEKMLFAGTTVVFFAVVNYVKLIPYYWLGQLNLSNLTATLILSPLAPLGIWAGVWLTRRVPEALFYKAAYVLLMATGLKLLYDGIAGPG
ncbi:sulfite exporter TauE/SafE family protein [Arenibaculum pallidiluteum]|uniref:sulfite exporter TauE/SafE family protein n=1 Tax=Arenibaculum pallidiluteum TaxID=2812559 RepID=UPI001A959429|nr:sulfite exporter TauE/SafE family protein [Arenibaculum pallidiluteum]